MVINKEVVEYVAHLSRIKLDARELETLPVELSSILDFIDKLKAADITNIPATSHILAINNVLRPDELSASLPANKAIENAPEMKEGFFSVPKVIE